MLTKYEITLKLLEIQKQYGNTLELEDFLKYLRKDYTIDITKQRLKDILKWIKRLVEGSDEIFVEIADDHLILCKPIPSKSPPIQAYKILEILEDPNHKFINKHTGKPYEYFYSLQAIPYKTYVKMKKEQEKLTAALMAHEYLSLHLRGRFKNLIINIGGNYV